MMKDDDIVVSAERFDEEPNISMILVGIAGIGLHADNRTRAKNGLAKESVAEGDLLVVENIFDVPAVPVKRKFADAHGLGEELRPPFLDERSSRGLVARRRTEREIVPHAGARDINRGTVDV